MTQSQTSMTSPIGDFFTVQDDFPVNLVALSPADTLPNDDQFQSEIPELFIIASSMAESDQQQLQSIRVEQAAGSALVAFLEQQHKRMNILLGYMLRNEDNPDHRFNGVAYGGGGIRVLSDTVFEPHQVFQAKLFFKEEALAIYCYVTVEACQHTDDGSYLCTLGFSQIREDDRELLIRASLHAQSRQLKQRSQQRRDEKESETPSSNS